MDVDFVYDIIHQDFDKAHRIGAKIKTNQTVEQSVILRLKSHSLRERIYRKRKNSRKLKVRVSQTNIRRKLLNYAKELTEDIGSVDFVFAKKKPLPSKMFYLEQHFISIQKTQIETPVFTLYNNEEMVK